METKPKILLVEDEEKNLNVGDLHCYLVSEHDHEVTTVYGSTPRILWMFGWFVPAEDWNTYKIKNINHV